MSDFEDERLSLIGEVQKLVLQEEKGRLLLTSDEAFEFFTSKSAPRMPALEKAEPKPVSLPYQDQKTKPLPVKKEPLPRPAASAPIKPELPPESAPEEKSPVLKNTPSFDLKMLRETIGKLRPKLKILDEMRDIDLQVKTASPHCLILGIAGNAEEIQVMESIKSAVEGVLKKTASVHTANDPKALQDLIESVSSSPAKLILISKEALSLYKGYPAVFKVTDHEKLGYLSGVPTILLDTFRGLNSSPSLKRELWNLIKNLC